MTLLVCKDPGERLLLLGGLYLPIRSVEVGGCWFVELAEFPRQLWLASRFELAVLPSLACFEKILANPSIEIKEDSF